MKTDRNYQPEDIEALLAEKAFNELYDEERAFVLGHLSSAGEYERMREMLLAIRGGAGGEDTGSLGPAPRVKRELLEEFGREQRRRRALWWNSVGLWFRDNLRLDLAVVRVAFAAVALVLAVWLGFRLAGGSPAPELAKNTDAPVPQQVVPSPAPGNTAAVPGKEEEEKAAPAVSPVQSQDAVLPPSKKERLAVTPVPPATAHDRVPVTNTATAAGNDQKFSVIPPDTMEVLATNVTANTNVVTGNPEHTNPPVSVNVDSATATACCGTSTALISSGGTPTYALTPATTTVNATAPANYSIVTFDLSNTTAITVTPVAAKSSPLSANAQLIPFYFELK